MWLLLYLVFIGYVEQCITIIAIVYNHLPNTKISPTFSHLIPTTIFQGAYYYFPSLGMKNGSTGALSNTYKVTQLIRGSVGMSL